MFSSLVLNWTRADHSTFQEADSDGIGAYALNKAGWAFPGLRSIRNGCRCGLQIGVGNYLE